MHSDEGGLGGLRQLKGALLVTAAATGFTVDACQCVCRLSYLAGARTGGAGDPGVGGVASSFSSSERGRYTSVLLPGLDTHTHTHTHTFMYTDEHTCRDTGTQEEL